MKAIGFVELEPLNLLKLPNFVHLLALNNHHPLLKYFLFSKLSKTNEQSSQLIGFTLS